MGIKLQRCLAIKEVEVTRTDLIYERQGRVQRSGDHIISQVCSDQVFWLMVLEELCQSCRWRHHLMYRQQPLKTSLTMRFSDYGMAAIKGFTPSGTGIHSGGHRAGPISRAAIAILYSRHFLPIVQYVLLGATQFHAQVCKRAPSQHDLGEKVTDLHAGVVTQAKANALADKSLENTGHVLLESTRYNAGFLK